MICDSGLDSKPDKDRGGGAVMQSLGLGSTALRILKYEKILLKLSLSRNNYGLVKKLLDKLRIMVLK